MLPHVPPDFPLPEPEQHNETYEGLSRDYRRICTLGLRPYTWESIFPVGRLNTPVTVDALDLSVRRNGDIAYSIRCTEYRFVV